jgi:thymidylate synthase ThyX
VTFKVRIEADSISRKAPRLTTFVLEYPRFIHAEVMTHRGFSRNASSSRAIPIGVLCDRADVSPAYWGKNQRGMQARQEMAPRDARAAGSAWNDARKAACRAAEEMGLMGAHKQIANRVLEPFSTIHVVLTGVSWTFEHFFALRCHPDAQPEMQILAWKMADLYYAFEPTEIAPGEWHTPFSDGDLKVSAARCARVSYAKHDGTEATPEEDYALHDRLFEAGHLSPFEHQAQAPEGGFYPMSNLKGWLQYRKTLTAKDLSFNYTEANANRPEFTK